MNGINLSFGVVADNSDALIKALAEMKSKAVYAGFPEDEKPRTDGSPITNAAIAYVQNTGAPEQNIPSREFMVSGIESKRDPISDGMQEVGTAALDGDIPAAGAALHKVGLTAQNGIRNKIIEGPFEPLAESTLKARARRGRDGAQQELDRRAAGEDPGTDLARPLNDTGQMRNAVTYVIRKD